MFETFKPTQKTEKAENGLNNFIKTVALSSILLFGGKIAAFAENPDLKQSKNNAVKIENIVDSHPDKVINLKLNAGIGKSYEKNPFPGLKINVLKINNKKELLIKIAYLVKNKKDGDVLETRYFLDKDIDGQLDAMALIYNKYRDKDSPKAKEDDMTLLNMLSDQESLKKEMELTKNAPKKFKSDRGSVILINQKTKKAEIIDFDKGMSLEYSEKQINAMQLLYQKSSSDALKEIHKK
jgi:hypothetical protein